MVNELIALPPGVVLDPIWDWNPGFALPIWLIVMLVFILFIVGSNLWWIYKFLIMRPVQGHGEAARSGNEKTQQVLMFGLNRAFSIQALEYMEKVLSFKDKSRVGKWLQTSPYAVGMLGYKSIMLVMEIFDTPKDPIAEMAIGVACHNHNIGLKNMDDGVTNYKAFRSNRDMLEHENPYGVDIPIYSLYNPGKIYQFTPVDRTSGQFGGTCLKDAHDLNMDIPQKSTWEKAIPVFICLVFAIVSIALVYMYVTSGNPAPANPLPASVIPGVK